MAGVIEPSERRTTETEPRGHFHQVGERIGLHLLHHLAAVGFYRDFADAELATHLLVQPAGDHQVHDLAFATREGRVTVSYCPYLRLAIQCSATALDGLADGAQQDVVAEWLRQELDSSPLHRLDGHRHVSVACDEDDGHIGTLRRDAPLYVEAIEAWKGNVKYEAARHRDSGAGEEFLRGRERLRLPARDRKSTRLNSSHSQISYAVFCLKKKKI